MTFQKRHYAGAEQTTQCGLQKNGRDLVTGYERVHEITCKNCQRSIVSCVNTGNDVWVTYKNGRLVQTRENK